MSIVVNKTRLPVTQWQTESGSVVSISDARKRYAKSLSVALEPIQDLHGYSNPWVGGAGKNKFNKDTLSPANEYDNLANGYRYCDTIILKPNTQYTISPTSTASLGVSDYYVLYINPDASDTDYLVITNADVRYVVHAGTPKTITFMTGATGAIRFGVVVQGSGIKEEALSAFMSIDYQLEEGSTATAWTPYANICPISGHSSVTAYNDPKHGGTIEWNQLFVPVTEWKAESAQTSISISEGVITATLASGSPSVYAPAIRPNSGISVTTVANHLYYCSCKFKASTNNYPYLRNNTAFTTATIFGTEITSAGTWGSYENIVSASSEGGVAWYIGHTNANILQVGDYFSIKEMMCIDLTAMFGTGNEPTLEQFRALFPKDYYEYNAGTETLVSAVNGDPCWNVSVSLGQTVYKGSVDLVSGVMILNRAMVVYDGSNDETWNISPAWGKTNTAVFYTTSISGAYYPDWTDYRGILTNLFLNATRNYTYNNDVECCGFSGTAVTSPSPTIRILKTRANDVASFRSFLNSNNLQFCYELATPQTIQLSPNEVEMLMRNNTVWSDAGVVTLNYARIHQ